MAHQAITSPDGVETSMQVVVGLFKNEYEAHAAIAQLKADGFSASEIGAAFRTRPADLPGSTATNTHHGHESLWDKVKDAFRTDESVERHPDVRQSAVENAGSGTGFASDDYEYDLAHDDFQGSLAGAGISDTRAAYLSRNLEPGGAIVTVRNAIRALDAEEILAANNGRVRYEDVETEYAQPSSSPIDAAASTGRAITDTGYSNEPAYEESDLPTGRSASPNLPVDSSTAARSAGERVQLFGEVLRVHKDRVQRGEVRVRKDVVTENQTIEVPVTREEFVLERVPVSGTIPAPSGNIGRDQEIRVPLSEDKVRLEKQEVVREEVLIGKREVSDVASVSDAVQHEELRIDSDLQAPKRAVNADETSEDVRQHG